MFWWFIWTCNTAKSSKVSLALFVYQCGVKLMLFLVQTVSFMYMYICIQCFCMLSWNLMYFFLSGSYTCRLWILRLVQRLQIMRFGLILLTFFCHFALKQGVYSSSKREMLYSNLLKVLARMNNIIFQPSAVSVFVFVLFCFVLFIC